MFTATFKAAMNGSCAFWPLYVGVCSVRVLAMPFVQRNWKGEITGLYANPQPQPDGTSLTDPLPLPDDHPDVVAFLAKQPPLPPEILKPPSEEELAQIRRDHERIEREHMAIRDAVVAFNSKFAALETALSALLYSILNLANSKLAYAIYYSPTSFDARATLVENCIIQIASEQAPLAEIPALWKKIVKKINRARNLRNALAHGAQTTLMVNNKPHARFTAPAFDVIRIGRVLSERQIPGLTANDISAGRKNLIWLIDAADCVNRLIGEFHSGNPSLLEKYRLLNVHLQADGNP